MKNKKCNKKEVVIILHHIRCRISEGNPRQRIEKTLRPAKLDYTFYSKILQSNFLVENNLLRIFIKCAEFVE